MIFTQNLRQYPCSHLSSKELVLYINFICFA